MRSISVLSPVALFVATLPLLPLTLAVSDDTLPCLPYLDSRRGIDEIYEFVVAI